MTRLAAASRCIPGLLFLLLLASPIPAAGEDGAVEISQASAVAGGTTPSDGPGFPVTLDAPGTYVVTSDLRTPSITVVGIEVEADRVTIDLNGHTLDGRARCTGLGEGVSCSPGNNADGINGAGFSRTTVRDGRITGFARGVLLGEASRVTSVDASRNASSGIDVGSASQVEGCRVLGNAGSNEGLRAGPGSTVTGNTVRGNAGDGILAAEGVLVRGNSVTRNGEDGIVGLSGALVTDNAVHNNGNSAGTGFQLRLNSDAAYVINSLVSTGGNGTVIGGVALGANACNGSASCP